MDRYGISNATNQHVLLLWKSGNPLALPLSRHRKRIGADKTFSNKIANCCVSTFHYLAAQPADGKIRQHKLYELVMTMNQQLEMQCILFLSKPFNCQWFSQLAFFLPLSLTIAVGGNEQWLASKYMFLGNIHIYVADYMQMVFLPLFFHVYSSMYPEKV